MKQCYTHVLRFSVVALLLLSVCSSRAQFVTIPDANFVTYLNTHGYAGCLTGNQLDTSCVTVLSTHGLYCGGLGIYNLTGLQYFKNLDTLDCSRDSLQSLPALPATLQYLNCGYNQLSNLPTLPAALTYLSCEQNALSNLPALPAAVTQINCGFNQLNSLPTLPSALTLLYCNYNSIINLPALPAHLLTLNCSENILSYLPILPNTLQQLICQSNAITALPTLSTTALTYLNFVGNMVDSIPPLPGTLQTLLCSTNIITSLPALPANLTTLSCDGNQLDSLPALPAGLTSLNCGMNNISVLPVLPLGITSLQCYQNQLSSLPELPDSLYQLYCYFNPNITCLPQLKRIVNLRFFNCGVTCLPDYGIVTNSSPALNTLPLCTQFNSTGCNIYSNISGRVFYDANNNCSYSGADAPQPVVKMELLSNGNLLQQTYTDSNGEYSFQAPYGNYVVKADTTGFAFKNNCPHSGYFNVAISATDSAAFGDDFAFVCRPTGYDLGVHSIQNNYVTPAPSNVITINTIAGDLSALYGKHCESGTSADVQLTFNGPVTYMGPAPGALAPTISANTLSWSVIDFGAINNYTAFNTMFKVNTNAVPGAGVCITVSILPAPNDFYPENNTLTYCFTVTNTQAANVKEVYPAGQIDSSSKWLTYTIRFANTGNDTASNIQITDTLDPNLNVSTFQLLNTSAKNLTQVMGNVVKFSFAGINLPAHSVNDSLSGGYVQYRIKTLSNLPEGTVISNTAAIAFNAGTPFITNAATDTVIQTPNAVQSLQPNAFDLRVFPNPANSQLYIQINQPGTFNIKLFDIEGKQLYTVTSANSMQAVNVSAFAPGIYIIEISMGEMVQRARWIKD